MAAAIDQEPVRILMVLGPPDDSVVTWTPEMERWRARDCMRDFGHAEWYDGSPVGWDPCGAPACSDPDHVRPVMRALIEDMPRA